MKLYLDSADVNEVARAVDVGVLDGVTTNPTLIAAEGRARDAVIRDLLDLVPGEVWCQVGSTDAAAIEREARQVRDLGERVVVKVPMNLAGLHAATRLSADDIPVNMTTIYSVPQALLAAKAGARWVSPYVGRIDDTGDVGVALVGEIVRAFREQRLDTRVLAASVRGPRHVTDLALAGVDGLTMPLTVLAKLAEHPLSDRDAQGFLADSQAERHNGRIGRAT